MSDELQKLYSIFIDEATERLAELEDGLLQLEKSPNDKELIDTIFRAAHTIKGSAGSIGLGDLSKFTHNVEETLDLLRKGKLSPANDLITVLLASADLMKEMVSSMSSGPAFDFTRCGELVKKMREIKGKGASGQFRIIFIPDRELLKKGIDPAAIIDEARKIGIVTSIKANTDAVPPLSQTSPDELYLRWDLVLQTDRDITQIRNLFCATGENSEVKIFPLTAPEREPLIGQLLVEDGSVKAEDVAEALRSQKRLGDILVEQEKVGAEEVEKVVERQKLRKIEAFRSAVSATIRVDLGKLDHLINIVGEMVITHSMLRQIIGCNGRGGTQEKLDNLFSQLERIGRDIQESAMSLRMLPVGDLFQRFARLVRELCGSRNKIAELVVAGEETELDKGVIEKITDPLIHLIRNAVDHGIETPDERTTRGKPAGGRINLIAFQMGDSVYIEVEDDGRGLNREKILGRAVSRGLISGPDGLTDEQIYNLIFVPGFTTADEVTDVSGRGVGMDVVKKNIESLNGRVTLQTRPGEGTTVSIRLPLTLMIVEGLTAKVGDEVYIIPITSVIESLRPRKEDVMTLAEKGEVVCIRGEFIPLIRLYEELGGVPAKRDPSEAIVVLVSHEKRKCCLMADELIGQQQVVIKSLGASVDKVHDIAGATILGTGKVALVLDVQGIIGHTMQLS